MSDINVDISSSPSLSVEIVKNNCIDLSLKEQKTVDITLDKNGPYEVTIETTPITVDIGMALPGVTGSYMAKVAGQNLSGHRAIFLDDSDMAIYADKNTYFRTIGVSLNAALIGEKIIINTQGEVIEPSWRWVPGKIIYLGNGGLLTQEVPTDGYILEVARAITQTKIFVKIGYPIKI